MARRRRPSELLAPGEYERMLAEQNGGCAICGRPPKTRRLHIDHDHKTGAIRGLACHRCNRGLQCFIDSPALLMQAAGYLVPGSHVYMVPPA